MFKVRRAPQRWGMAHAGYNVDCLIILFIACTMKVYAETTACAQDGRASLGNWQGGVRFGARLGFESPAFH